MYVYIFIYPISPPIYIYIFIDIYRKNIYRGWNKQKSGVFFLYILHILRSLAKLEQIIVNIIVKSQKKRNDSLLTIWHWQQEIYVSFLLSPFSGMYGNKFDHNLHLNEEWAEKKFTDFGPNRFRGFFAQCQFWLT